MPCAATARVPPGDDNAARAFFEAWFAPYSAAGPDGAEGLFTGYFEAELQGSRTPGGRYTVPIYRVPDDLVTVDLGKFDPGLKGRTVVGRVENGRLLPYYARRAIDAGALAGRGLELLWLDHPIDAFLLHVQGSGRVDRPDGSVVRVGFAGHNGRSEEHTSELQSLMRNSYAVFCLKKKKKQKARNIPITKS